MNVCLKNDQPGFVVGEESGVGFGVDCGVLEGRHYASSTTAESPSIPVTWSEIYYYLKFELNAIFYSNWKWIFVITKISN